MLDPAAAAIRDHLARTRGHCPAIFAAGLHSPALIGRLAAVGEYLRYESPLPAETRELVTLAIARDTGSRYEWAHHVAAAITGGVERAAIERLAARELDREPSPRGAAVRYACLVFAAAEVEAELFGEVRASLGDAGLVELTILIGYYLALARHSEALGVDVAPEYQRFLDHGQGVAFPV